MRTNDLLGLLGQQVGQCIMVAGATGLVGQSILRLLKDQQHLSILAPTRAELDLTCQAAVDTYFECQKPQSLIIAAGKVGGIWANINYPADFAFDNLMINANLLNAAHKYGVKRVLILGSSCIYPKLAIQPICEKSLLAGALEPTNDAYAIAKIAALKLGHSYLVQYGMDVRALMPTNLYGPYDTFDPLNSHVIPGLLWRMREAIQQKISKFEVWGTGTPMREFLYVDDLASAILEILCISTEQYRRHWSSFSAPVFDEFFYNVGSDTEVSIGELVEIIRTVTKFDGSIEHDLSKPDGTPRKKLDSSRLYRIIDWRPETSLVSGIEKTWEWFNDSNWEKK